MSKENKPKPITMKDVQAKAEEKKCPAQQSLIYIEEFLAEPMCGRCFPCSFGSYEARIRIKKLVDGLADDDDIRRLKRISSNMLEASMCKKGKDTAKFILEKIESEAFTFHIKRECADSECSSLFEYIIIPEKCIMCGKCQDVCKDNAVVGERMKPYMSGYMPFEIAQKRCTKCGECIKVCPEDAVIIKTAGKIEPVGV